MDKRIAWAFGCLFMALGACMGAAAQADGPTEEEMIRALSPPAVKAGPPAAAGVVAPREEDVAPGTEPDAGMRLRGRKAVSVRDSRDATAGSREGRLQLSVPFELGSATIAESGKSLLGRLAKAMASPALAGLRYRIEGHTDATGTVAGNQRLSERRAESVTAFLIAAAGLHEDRFLPVGFGSSQPLDPADPQAAVNRRVVVVSFERSDGTVASTTAPASPATAPSPPATPSTAVTLGDGGRVQLVKGSLEIRQGGDGAPAAAGARIREGDELVTGAGASALVQLDDGASLLLRPDSTVRIATLKHAGEGLGQLVEVVSGACRYVTGSIGRMRPDRVALSTATATVGIRGTDLEVVYREAEAGPGGAGTYVKVNDGGVTVGGIDGTKVDLARGEKAFAGRPVQGLRGQPPAPAVRRVGETPGIFATGDLDSLLERR